MIKIKQAISKELSDYLREFTDLNDRADIVNEVGGIGSSTLRDLVFRVNPVTENNLPALKALMLRASKNAAQKMNSARKCKKAVKEILDCV